MPHQMTVNPIDVAIAAFVDKDLKGCASTAALGACECTDPQLRSALAEISQTAIARQAHLASLMMQKGYYVPAPADATTYNTVLPQLQAIAQGVVASHAGGVAEAPVLLADAATVTTTVAAATTTAPPTHTPTGGVTAPRLV
jgi:hypothetical protein